MNWQSVANFWNEGQFEKVLQNEEADEPVAVTFHCTHLPNSITIGVNKHMKLKDLNDEVTGLRLLGPFTNNSNNGCATFSSAYTLASVSGIAITKSNVRKRLADLDNCHIMLELEGLKNNDRTPPT